MPDCRRNKNALEPVNTETTANGLDAGAPIMLARLDAYMREARPWLSPDLTLVALARKLGVPSKTLSAVASIPGPTSTASSCAFTR